MGTATSAPTMIIGTMIQGPMLKCFELVAVVDNRLAAKSIDGCKMNLLSHWMVMGRNVRRLYTTAATPGAQGAQGASPLGHVLADGGARGERLKQRGDSDQEGRGRSERQWPSACDVVGRAECGSSELDAGQRGRGRVGQVGADGCEESADDGLDD